MTHVGLSGAARVRLVLALGRAHITPFDANDWSGWSGAVGDAQVVRFHKEDSDYLRPLLGIAHWPEDYTFVVLDETGLTWNGGSPVNSEAWQVCVGFDVSLHDAGTIHEVWRVEPRMVPGLEARIAALPPEVRSRVMAAPHDVRDLIVDGYNARRADSARLRDALALMQEVDFSSVPGLYDSIPWEQLELASK